MSHPETYFQIVDCPLSHECNEKNFAQWRPWGKTPEEAREQVVKHLMGSGLHKDVAADDEMRDQEFYERLVAECEVHEFQWTPPPPPKKSKKGEKRKPPSWLKNEIPLTPSSPVEPPPGFTATGSAEPASGSAAPSSKSGGAPPAADEGAMELFRSRAIMMKVTNMEYRAITDAAGRAAKAARNAQRLSTAAAGAFAEEAAIFEDIVKFMQNKADGAS